MAYHLSALSSDICLDTPGHGEGASTGCGHLNELISKTFERFADMLKYLADTYGLPKRLSDYEQDAYTLEYRKTVADHSQEQNGGWFEATSKELAAWRAGALKLYSEDYTIHWLLVS